MVPSLPYDTDGIRYAVCSPSDVPELIGLLSRTFAANDPPAMAVGLTPEELAAYLETVTGTAADDGLTIVARDLESRDMAGVLLTMDATVDQGPMEGLSPSSSRSWTSSTSCTRSSFRRHRPSLARR